jgi:hypothetical protein
MCSRKCNARKQKRRYINETVNCYHSSWLMIMSSSNGGMTLTGGNRRFFFGSTTLVRLVLTIAEVFISHSDKPHSVGLVRNEWLARPVAGIEPSSPGKLADADPRLRQRDPWNRRTTEVLGENTCPSTTLSTTIPYGLTRDRTRAFEARSWQQIKSRSHDYILTRTTCYHKL